MARLTLEIITAERIAFSDQVDLLTAPSVEGEVAILPNHAPLMAVLQPGEMRVVKGTEERILAVTGGFLEVLDNKVTVLADAAEHPEEIDVERARRAMQAAQEALTRRGEAMELERAVAAARRAEVRLRVAQRRRRGGPPGTQSGEQG